MSISCHYEIELPSGKTITVTGIDFSAPEPDVGIPGPGIEDFDLEDGASLTGDEHEFVVEKLYDLGAPELYYDEMD